MTIRPLAALLVTGLAAAVAAGQPVTIKLRRDMIGDKTKQTVEEETVTAMAQEVNGQKQEKTERKTTKFVYVEEVLAKPVGARKPTGLTRTYETAESATDGNKRKLSVQGKTVKIEKKGTTWEFTVDGKPLAGEEAKLLSEEFGKGDGPEDEDILPQKPVAAGGTWTPNMDKLVPLMNQEMPFEFAKSGNAASGKLHKVYPKDGKGYGEFEIAFSLKPTSIKSDGQTINLKPGCTLSIVMRLDGCIDGSVNTGLMTTQMNANLDCDLPGASLKLQIDGKKTHQIEPVKK
jgi:hypothetical protein